MLTALVPLDGEAVLALNAAKTFLRVDGDDQDELIAALRDAALDWVERHTARSFEARAWRWTTSGFDIALRLPIGPVVGVDAIEYLDIAGVPVALAEDRMIVRGGQVLTAAGFSWPATSVADAAVSVEFNAGLADPGDIPPALVAAAKLLLGHLFANRETVITGTIATEVPFGVMTLCAPFRSPVIR